MNCALNQLKMQARFLVALPHLSKQLVDLLLLDGFVQIPPDAVPGGHCLQKIHAYAPSSSAQVKLALSVLEMSSGTKLSRAVALAIMGRERTVSDWKVTSSQL